MNQSLPKSERLCSQKIIGSLFKKDSKHNHSAFCYPFRVVYQHDATLAQNLSAILISVPKKTFKHATDRNLLKRRIREAYRLNKNLLQSPPSSIFFQYIAKETLLFDEIEKKMKRVLGMIGGE